MYLHEYFLNVLELYISQRKRPLISPREEIVHLFYTHTRSLVYSMWTRQHFHFVFYVSVCQIVIYPLRGGGKRKS